MGTSCLGAGTVSSRSLPFPLPQAQGKCVATQGLRGGQLCGQGPKKRLMRLPWVPAPTWTLFGRQEARGVGPPEVGRLWCLSVTYTRLGRARQAHRSLGGGG